MPRSFPIDDPGEGGSAFGTQFGGVYASDQRGLTDLTDAQWADVEAAEWERHHALEEQQHHVNQGSNHIFFEYPGPGSSYSSGRAGGSSSGGGAPADPSPLAAAAMVRNPNGGDLSADPLGSGDIATSDLGESASSLDSIASNDLGTSQGDTGFDGFDDLDGFLDIDGFEAGAEGLAGFLEAIFTFIGGFFESL